jgi:hypothetical protein
MKNWEPEGHDVAAMNRMDFSFPSHFIRDTMDLEDKVTALQRENAELVKDRERLEWLVQDNSSIQGNWILIQLYLNYRNDWREAIDEAMREADDAV